MRMTRMTDFQLQPISATHFKLQKWEQDWPYRFDCNAFRAQIGVFRIDARTLHLINHHWRDGRFAQSVLRELELMSTSESRKEY
jgi:hypothetical protein